METKPNFSMLIFFSWMRFYAAQAHEKTTPTRLTGLGKNITTIPVALLDQCFPHEESKTFGIEFRLPPTGGSCDDGLIICYLGSLATRTMDNVHSMNGLSVNSELFNVDNAVNNSLAKYCAGKLNVSWHGIKVHTEKLNGKNIIKLSTSLLEDEEQSFEMPDAQRQFIIYFGNENEFSAYATVDGGQQIDFDVEKAEQYMKTAPKGAHLKDFFGFWTLGLDMLPWMDHEVELFVNRTCSCSMEAWFIRPTDGVPKDPKEPSTGIGGPKTKCIGNTTKEVPLNNNLKANHLIRIQMLIDGNALHNNISFQLLGLNKPALMTFTISEKNASMQMNVSSKPKGMKRDYLPKGNGTLLVEFIIAFTEYSYGIKMNGGLLGRREFFPENWWLGLPFKNMTSLWLHGQFLLLADPLVMPFKMFGQQNYVPQIQPPNWTRIPNLQNGTKFAFRLKIGQSDKNFSVSFLHNRLELPKSGDSIGAEILRVNVQPETNQIFLQSYKEGKLIAGGNITLKKYNKTLEAGKAYEFHIVTGSNQFNITLDGILIWDQNKTFLPIWATNFLRIDGNVTVLGKFVYIPPKMDEFKFTNFTVHLKSLLDYNDIIQLRLKNRGKAFSILLLHDALEENNEIGDVVLKMTFDFNGGRCSLSCRYLLNAEADMNATAKDNYRNLTESVDGRLNKYGQEFDMKITALNDSFKIYIKQVKLTHFCPYPKSNGTVYPPWAVDYIRFQDNVEVHAMNVTHPPTSRINFKQINDLVRPGELITVKLAIKALKANPSVAINLFHQALQFNEKVGKTVMKVMLNATALCFSSSKPLINNSTNEQNCTNGKLDKELKKLEIGVMDDAFNVTLALNNDSRTTYTYSDGLPQWAVHYITVDYNNVTLSNPPIITCVPVMRCKRPNNGMEQYNIKKDSIQI